MHHQRITKFIQCGERFDRRRQHEAFNAEYFDDKPPQHQKDQRCDPWCQLFEPCPAHELFPGLMWRRHSCTRSTKPGSKVISSVRGRGSGMMRDATTLPGRGLMMCTVSDR